MWPFHSNYQMGDVGMNEMMMLALCAYSKAQYSTAAQHPAHIKWSRNIVYYLVFYYKECNFNMT